MIGQQYQFTTNVRQRFLRFISNPAASTSLNPIDLKGGKIH
jgi:hypothetical protein